MLISKDEDNLELEISPKLSKIRISILIVKTGTAEIV